MSSEIIFRADSICKAYRGRPILSSATLWAHSSRITVLFGRNGSGKTTLMRIAAGLLPADQGVVIFRDRAWPVPRLHELAREGLFHLPERGLLVRNIRVREHFAAVIRRFGGRSAEQHIAALQLAELLDRRPDTLSGGERRRVEVALAMTREPTLLLADEPFMGVAPRDVELLSGVFRQLTRDGRAVVISGHEVPALLELADEVVWLSAGTTHGLGSAAAARQNWQFRREYLGT